jgi:hypothetical protein
VGLFLSFGNFADCFREIGWEDKRAYIARTQTDGSLHDFITTVGDRKTRFDLNPYDAAEYQLQREWAILAGQDVFRGVASILDLGSGAGCTWRLKKKEMARAQKNYKR